LARKNDQGRKIPQAIAHRGYKAAHPENTMRAFKGAVEVGAHAIETDLHISKDSVVVLSHVSHILDEHVAVSLEKLAHN
jgi:glycerophosphoryl diester phosphodiesterase